jgi:hypothetical protein
VLEVKSAKRGKRSTFQVERGVMLSEPETMFLHASIFFDICAKLHQHPGGLTSFDTVREILP